MTTAIHCRATDGQLGMESATPSKLMKRSARTFRPLRRALFDPLHDTASINRIERGAWGHEKQRVLRAKSIHHGTALRIPGHDGGMARLDQQVINRSYARSGLAKWRPGALAPMAKAQWWHSAVPVQVGTSVLL
ncbi:MAG: hypothetical protein V3V08_12870 [Nannocystaceae bacterium]